MKTSNKIFIGLLVTIFMVIMAFLIDIRVFGEHRSERFSAKNTEDFSIGHFEHVRVDHLSSFYLDPLSDKNFIQFESFRDSIKSFIDYSISNDTLIIHGKEKKSFYKYTLHYQGQIKSITLNNARAELNGMDQDSIVFNVKNGEVNGYRNNQRKDSHFKMAKFNMKDSKINLYSIQVDSLMLDMEKSNARIETDVHKIHASLKSNSELNLRKVTSLDIDKDESSKLRIY